MKNVLTSSYDSEGSGTARREASLLTDQSGFQERLFDMPKKGRRRRPIGEPMNLAVLARTPLFKTMPQDELHHLAATLAVREVGPKTLLMREGEAGDQFYIIIQGEIEIVKAMDTDNHRLVAIRGPGDFVGELSLLNPDGLRTASARTRGPAQLLEITHAEMDALLRRQPQLAYELAHQLSLRLTEAQDAVIRDLHKKNEELVEAYRELKEAQLQIIEKERLERELQVAHDIQMSILPQTLPRLTGYDFGARIVPARAVGGDFFDLFPLSEDKIGIVIGDVADKGVPSAIFMARTHAFLYAEANLGKSPTETLLRVNRHLMETNQLSLFVTVLYGVLNGKNGEFSYARAGHELPAIITSYDHAAQAPWSQGQLLGLLESPKLDEQSLFVPEDGMVLLYTDGIPDGRNSAGVPFGYERLLREARELIDCSAQEVCDRMLERVVAYRGEALQDDDVALVCIQSRNTSGRMR